MVKCPDCKKEMLDINVESCSKNLRCIQIEGKVFERDTEYYDYNERCHDCNILNKPGNIHHYGCDIERCPACGSQLISCNCHKEYLGNKTHPKIKI